MNNEEKLVIEIINEKFSFKPNFKSIENKINLPNKQQNLIFNILLCCESIAFMYSLFMTIIIQLKPIGEGGESKTNMLYLLLSISLVFIIIITLLVKGIVNKNLKKGEK